MSENFIEEKAKITSYFPSNSTPIYKLINQDNIESKSNEIETAYFLETTNSIVSNGYRRLSLKTSTFNYNTNNNAKNLLLPTNNESNDDDRNRGKSASTARTTTTTKNGVPSFNVFFQELKKAKKTSDPNQRKRICFNYFS